MILLQNPCHYNISKYILHSYFLNSCTQLKKSTPFPCFFLNSCSMQESFREWTPKSLFYQILTFTISNPIMLKLDVQAVRTKASSLQCTYFKAITFIFQTATKKNPEIPSEFFMIPNFFLKFLKPQKGLVKTMSMFSGSKFLAHILKCAFLNVLFYWDKG